MSELHAPTVAVTEQHTITTDCAKGILTDGQPGLVHTLREIYSDSPIENTEPDCAKGLNIGEKPTTTNQPLAEKRKVTPSRVIVSFE